MYQLSQLACAMAVDLGLGNKPKDQDTNLSVDAFACPPDETGENLSSPTLERMRTYVGCYTITSRSVTASFSGYHPTDMVQASLWPSESQISCAIPTT